jgi:hypothetical protein
MKYFKYIIILFFASLFFVSCSDEWSENQTENQLQKHHWYLHMYVDGVKNEVVSIGEMEYIFEGDGKFTKISGDSYEEITSWEVIDVDLVKIGTTIFRIKTLTNRILSLEYGEDVLYFLPHD